MQTMEEKALSRAMYLIDHNYYTGNLSVMELKERILKKLKEDDKKQRQTNV